MTRRIRIGSDGWIRAAKRAIDAEGAVELVYRPADFCIEYNIRGLVFSTFRAEQVTCVQNAKDEIIYLVESVRIRTTRLKPVTRQLEVYPEKLDELEGYGRGSIKGFDDAEALEDLGPIAPIGTCACCGKTLPVGEFSLRAYAGRVYRQSYCRRCMSAYQYWYYRFLKGAKADRLVDEFTEGRRKRNELFREWFQTYQEGL